MSSARLEGLIQIFPARLIRALDALRVNEVEMKYILIVITLLLICPLTQAQKSDDVPENWKREAKCGVSFYLPSDIKVPIEGIGKCAGLFESETMSVYLETDPFSFEASKPSITRFDKFAGKVNFRRVETKIDSRKAIIVTYYDPEEERFPYSSALSIAAKGGFRMYIGVKKAEDQALAEKIFRSVRFSE